MATSLPPSTQVRRPRILLIGNHPRDRQESMQRFAQAMHAGLSQRGFPVRLIRPPATAFANAGWDPSGPARYLGYVDKFLIFPKTLARHLAWADVVHICDHGNAMYMQWTHSRPTLITCHDLLAVRAALLGEDTDCPPSRAGRFLQRWVVSGLRRAQRIAAVSRYTLNDIRRVLAQYPHQAQLIHNGLNYAYSRKSAATSRDLVASQPWFTGRPFIIHVGSNERRKNRAGVLRIFASVAGRWPGDLIFVGQTLSAELEKQVDDLGLRSRIHHVSGLDNARLEALYNLAHALIFPSSFEGFGWPIIEAQACGCPVVCSDCGPFREIAGPGACIRPLTDETGMADDLVALNDPGIRHTHIALGLTNAGHFSADRMIEHYTALYQELSTVA